MFKLVTSNSGLQLVIPAYPGVSVLPPGHHVLATSKDSALLRLVAVQAAQHDRYLKLKASANTCGCTVGFVPGEAMWSPKTLIDFNVMLDVCFGGCVIDISALVTGVTMQEYGLAIRADQG